MRWVGRLILMLGLLLLPLWIYMTAGEAGASEARAAPTFIAHEGAGAADPGSSSPADCPEDGAGALEEDDDDASDAEMMPPASATRVHASDARFTRLQRRCGASPPRVHIDAETPPPRA